MTALPPDEGVELADVDYAQDEQSVSRHRGSIHASIPSEGGRSSPLTGSVGPPAIPFATTAIRMDDTVFSTKIGCGTHSVNDNCTCVQLQDGCLTEWSKVGC